MVLLRSEQRGLGEPVERFHCARRAYPLDDADGIVNGERPRPEAQLQDRDAICVVKPPHAARLGRIGIRPRGW